MSPEELLKSKNIDYMYSGGDVVVKCLNPEHDDASPSMRIDKLTGKYNCFSCGYSGSIFSLFGVVRNMLDVRVQLLKDKISKLNKPKQYLPLNREVWGREHRGISAETFKKFNAFTADTKEYDGRLVFPITDIYGDIACFVGRYLHSNANPKYIIRPTSTTVPLHPQLPKVVNGSVVLVEGLFDMLNLYDKGMHNVITLFTANLGKNHEKVLKRFENYKLLGINKIYLLLDGDDAGRAGAKNLKRILQDMFIVEVLELPEGADPGGLSHKDVDSLIQHMK